MPATQSYARPRISRLLLHVFSYIARRRMRKQFRAVRILYPERVVLLDGPLIVYLNHPSWWDPLMCLRIARRLLAHRHHYAPISTDSLKQYGFFRHLGLFPVDQGTPRGAVQFLRTSVSILEREGAVLWVTAQGHFTDARERPVALKGGLPALLKRLPSVTVVPLAVEYTFWNQRSPEALACLGLPIHVRFGDGDMTQLLEQRLQAVQDELAAASMLRDEATFTTLLQGSRGTAGIYGLWQRLRAGMRGEDYQQDHAAATASKEP